ncbi:MaoC/PaaZ C-terminal domain-containing protein [Solibacillus sp. FSL K6-1523]|uniref:MaoC/PaaZ C-terminal domain-containing protein n=1 Tax=Solibacillus sp. FSL K6-1523 TaxID=2921471 RepID=UPI0030F6D2B9
MGVLFFEDFEVGSVLETPARTITESDVLAFAGLSGDYNALHTDIETCKNTKFGQRIAHGLLGISIATGLTSRLGIFEGSAVALLGINNWKFLNPIFFGDTIHVRLTITDKRLSKSNPDTGVLSRSYEIVNQRGEVVQKGEMPVMIRTKNSVTSGAI